MAFGHEVGRALSDGQVIGRSEPFAKVFPSSRVVKRAVGLVAWGVLEDIALDAYLDADGRLVAETSVRRIARNLGLNKDTVTRHLAKLREYGFVLHEENRDDGNGRYATCRYVLDPAACIERFTTTPTTASAPARTSGETSRDLVRRPGPRPAPAPACAPAHRSDPHIDLDLRVRAELERLGVAVNTAAELVERFPLERIRAALAAVGTARPRSRPAWVIAAIRQGWTLPAATPTTFRAPDDATPDDCSAELWDQWDRALSAVLSDHDLRTLAVALGAPVPGVGWLVPAVRAEIVRWASYEAYQAGLASPWPPNLNRDDVASPPSQWAGPCLPPPRLPIDEGLPLVARLRAVLG